MSIVHKDGMTTITCDKCGDCQHAPSGCYNEVFAYAKWALNKGRKYEHLCFSCLPAKTRKYFNP